MNHADTDILIVGGGAAGATAALKAREEGMDVLLVVKGFLGRSGASIFAGNLGVNLPRNALSKDILGGEEKQWLDIRAKYYFYLYDEEYTNAYLKYTQEKWLPWMESMGMYIQRKEDGSLLTSKLIPETWAPKQGASGRNVMDILRKEIISKDIKVMEETMVTSLFTSGKSVVGAMLLNYSDLTFTAVRAKSTIIATGLANYMAVRSTGTREQCANGLAMAYRAGAELYDLEIQHWHTSDLAHPSTWMRLHCYPNPMPDTRETTRQYNSKGELLYELKTMNTEIVAPYHIQLKKLIKSVNEGKAGFTEGYYTSYAHMGKVYLDKLDNYSTQVPFFKRITPNWETDKLENAVTWHMTYGGIKVNNKTMQSSLDGLFAAGGVAGHSTIHVACYDGEIAAKSAIERAKKIEIPTISEQQVNDEETRIKNLLRKEGIAPATIKNKIRQIMWDYMGPIKNGEKMNQCLNELNKIRTNLLPKMGLTSDTKNWNYELIDALDVFDMLDVDEITIKSSLARKESRGPFYREDYPRIDNINFLKYSIIRREDGDDVISFEPIKFKSVKAPQGIVDYFEADY